MIQFHSSWFAIPHCIFALGLTASLTDAAPIAIVNAGFESNLLSNPPMGQPDNFIVAAGEGATITAVPGWTFVATQIDTFTSYGGVSDLGVFNHSLEGPLDNNIAWLFINQGRRTGAMSVFQTLGDTLQNNTRYTLTLRVAQSAHAEGNQSLPDPNFPALGDGVSTGDVFARMRVGSTATAMPGFLPGESTVSIPPNNEWVNWTLSWQTGPNESLAGAPLVIELFNRANTQGSPLPVEVFFDDVTLSAVAVPEPSVSALAAALGVLLGLRRQRPTAVKAAQPRFDS